MSASENEAGAPLFHTDNYLYTSINHFSHSKSKLLLLTLNTEKDIWHSQQKIMAVWPPHPTYASSPTNKTPAMASAHPSTKSELTDDSSILSLDKVEAGLGWV